MKKWRQRQNRGGKNISTNGRRHTISNLHSPVTIQYFWRICVLRNFSEYWHSLVSLQYFQNICIPSFIFEEKIDGHHARHTKIHWFKTIAKSNSIFWKGKEPPSRFFSKNLNNNSSSTTGRPLWFCVTYLPTRLANTWGTGRKPGGRISQR